MGVINEKNVAEYSLHVKIKWKIVHQPGKFFILFVRDIRYSRSTKAKKSEQVRKKGEWVWGIHIIKTIC